MITALVMSFERRRACEQLRTNLRCLFDSRTSALRRLLRKSDEHSDGISIVVIVVLVWLGVVVDETDQNPTRPG